MTLAFDRLTRLRLAIAIGIGIASGALTAVWHQTFPLHASDFDLLWIAARALRAHQDPYLAVHDWGWRWPMYYPLPAVVAVLPLAWLPLPVARALFAAISATALSFGLSTRGWWWLVVFLSGAYFWAALSVQLTPLITAAALIPALRPLYAAKPTTGLPLLALDPNRRGVVMALTGMALLTVISLMLDPEWPAAWLAAIQDAPHIRPALTRPFGWLLLLSVLRWRRPAARYLLLLACAPQNALPHEMLPLVLVAETPREVAWFTLSTLFLAGVAVQPDWTGRPFVDIVAAPWPYTLALVYLPALAMVLAKPNQTTPEPSRLP